MTPRNSAILAAALTFAACAHEKPKAAATAPEAKPALVQQVQQNATAQAEQVLAKPPPVPELKPFAAPVPHVETLANGLTLIVIERADAPLESIGFTSKHGAVHDGKLPGLASVTGEVLQAGSAGRSASQIAEAITALGTELHLGASREDLSSSLTVLPEKFPMAAALLGDVMLRPNLDPKEFARVKKERQARLVAMLDEPREVASEVVASQLYGESGYGQPLLGTKRSVDVMKLADVKKYLAGLSGANSAIFAAGPVPAAEVRAAVEKAFGALAKGKPEPKTEAKPAAKRPEIALVDKPGAPQSVLRLVEPSVDARNPDRYKLELANTVFGGSFTSRINQNLREQHGYTYGAHSDFNMMRGGGYFLAATDVKTDVTGAAITELHGELHKMVAPGLSEQDVEKARALFIQNIVEDLQTTPSTARSIAELWSVDLPLDEYSRMVPAVAHLTAADVNDAWKHAVDPAKLTLVVVGDAKSVAPQLEQAKLPKPTMVQPPK